MESLGEKVFLIFLDKTLLAVAGGGIAFFFSRALERYKREQAAVLERYKREQSVVLELGKLRAQAFAKILTALSSIHAIMNHALENRHLTEIPPEQLEIYDRLPNEAKKIHDAVLDGIGLMDKHTRALFKDYISSFEEFQLEGNALAEMSIEELERKRERISILQERLLAYIPPLPNVD